MLASRTRRKNTWTPKIVMSLIGIFGILFALCIINIAHVHSSKKVPNKFIPVVITTWAFTNATQKAWESVFNDKMSALTAIETGCLICEQEQCDGTVGFGGSPDENGETTLDAMIMDGNTMDVGAVANLRGIKNAISVARKVLHHTSHSILSGNQATEFAKAMGFPEESLSTQKSKDIWLKWKNKSCQPNFWKNVSPNPRESCGPYTANADNFVPYNRFEHKFGKNNHDTIGMVIIDSYQNIAAGTSTNGATHKIPGRVGDSPIPGAGAYADNDVGGAAATGDGDVMLRFLPTFLAVDEMRRGATPSEASNTAIRRIAEKVPSFVGGIVAVNKYGDYDAACHGLDIFHYSVCNNRLGQVTVHAVKCFNVEL